MPEVIKTEPEVAAPAPLENGIVEETKLDEEIQALTIEEKPTETPNETPVEKAEIKVYFHTP